MDEYEDNTFYPRHFAQPFLKAIKEFCDCNGTSMDNFDVYSVNEDVVEDTVSDVIDDAILLED
ncbi:hypothetical protein [Acinetobacter baumannii]|uniref:hypothetical protein n=1 Tax=Acinetobacter baumannii TaxID=470 RepID=UPI00117869F0